MKLNATTVFILSLGATLATANSWGADVFPFGQTLDLGGAVGTTADVSAFESIGSIFFDVNSASQDSGVNDPAFPPFGDEDLRDNLPTYITAGPGAEYAGVSGGWGYQQILVGDGNMPDPFESGVAINSGTNGANAGEILTFTAGADVLPDIRFGVVIDILDSPAFVPADITVAVGDNSATVTTAAANRIGDIYQFDVTGIVPGDEVSIVIGNAPAFTSTIAGVVLDIAEPFPLEMIVNTATGNVALENNSAFSTSAVIQGYSIASADGSLNPSGWNSLQEQGFDGGNTIPNDGVGWEQLGDGTTNLVGEFKLDGPSTIPAGSRLSLGQLFQTGGTQDLTFEVSTGTAVVPIRAITYDDAPAGGDFNGDGEWDCADINALTEAIAAMSTDLTFDMNGDGQVTLADITDAGVGWLAVGGAQNSGATGGNAFLSGDANLDGSVDVSDFNAWNGNKFTTLDEWCGGDFNADGSVDVSDFNIWNQGKFTNSSGGNAVVPEPASSLMVVYGMMCVLGCALHVQRARKNDIRGTTSPLTKSFLILGIVTTAMLVVAAPVSADFTLDRDYRMGDDDNDVGTPTAGADVGSTTSTGDTFDSMGQIGDGSLVDLTPSGTPVYATTTGRPLLTGSGLGIMFDGIDDYVSGSRLGLPETSFSSTGGDNAGPLDYSGIANRGYQFWVRPSSAGQGNAAAQSVVADTNQHAVRISDSDTWVMRYASTDADSGVTVGFDTWSHVMLVRPFGPTGPDNGSRLYVNGVAVAAASDGYDGADDFPLVVGAATGMEPGGDFFSGIIDDLEMFVLGTSNDTMIDYGTFDFNTDNEYAAGFTVADGGLSDYVPGDATGDGQVTGDGSGSVATDDVSAFVAGWRVENLVNGIRVADVNSPSRGDFNFDGFTNIHDWIILDANYQGTADLNLNDLLASIPEPSSITLLMLAAAALGMCRRQRTCPQHRASLTAAAGRRCCSNCLIFGILASILAVVLGSHTTASADVTAVGVDQTTDALWRTAAALEADNQYGTDGYVVYGLDRGDSIYQEPWDGTDSQSALPSAITEITIPAGEGLWSGNGNFGLMEDPNAGNALTAAPVTANGITGANPRTYTISRRPGSAFRLSVLLASGDDQSTEYTSSVEDGTGAVGLPPVAHTMNGLHYHVYDISEGSSDVVLTLSASSGGNPQARGVTGFAFDNFLFPAFPVLTVDRDTGGLMLSNPTADPISMIAYEMVSDAGALNPSNWLSIAENYDADSGGAVDDQHTWIEFTSDDDRDNLAEAQQPIGDGAILAAGASIDLGTAWIKYPVEDVTLELALSDGTTLDVDVQFTGNGGVAFQEGDLNFDSNVDVADWNYFKPQFGTDASGLSQPEAYQVGDLNYDGIVDLADANEFASVYDAANGQGAFDDMLASVPEPTAATLLLLSGFAWLAGRRSGLSRKP